MPEDPQLQGVKLHILVNDIEAPELSIVIPALNEEPTIQEFVSWCQEGLAEAGVKGDGGCSCPSVAANATPLRFRETTRSAS
jgi:hypothetical protein